MPLLDISPRVQATQNVLKHETELNILNERLVTTIRALYYAERLSQGWKPDVDAQTWMHVFPLAVWADWHRQQRYCKQIVDVIEQKALSEKFVEKWDELLHEAMHEVLGECMYDDDGLGECPYVHN